MPMVVNYLIRPNNSKLSRVVAIRSLHKYVYICIYAYVGWLVGHQRRYAKVTTKTEAHEQNDKPDIGFPVQED